MTDFLSDIRANQPIVGLIAGMIAAAIAVGGILPMAAAYVSDAFPSLAPFLGVEGTLLGIGAVYLPAGMAAITAACVALEAVLLGYKDSTLKRVVRNDTVSVRTDLFYLLLRISGLMLVFSLIFSFGAMYVAADYVKSTVGVAILARFDGVVIQFAVLVVLYTFLNYWAHRMMHTKYFWEIHQIHHSAEHYNVLLPYRNHPVEYIVATIYGVGAIAFLGVSPEIVMLWLAVNAVYQSMVHSNYDWKWRWVEFILITPATHRIHHSTAREHYDSNFGILSIWDRLFGTYVPPVKQPIHIGVPARQNFNTGRYFGEMIACFFRWLAIKRLTRRRAH